MTEEAKPASKLVDKRSRRGMKNVGRHNWLSADPVSLATLGGPLDDESGIVALVETGNRLADLFSECEVSAAVSEEAARLFHVGRGIIVYAVFFYPLLDAGLEKAFAAVEVATKEACEVHAMPKALRTSHSDRTDWLCEFGWIDIASCRAMHAVRWLRNHAVHDRQNLVGPRNVRDGLYVVRDLLETLAIARVATSPRYLSNVIHNHRELLTTQRRECTPLGSKGLNSNRRSMSGRNFEVPPRDAANRCNMGSSAQDAYRVTTTLTQAQRRELEQLAKSNSVKVAWLIRRAVERMLEQSKGSPLLPLDFK